MTTFNANTSKTWLKQARIALTQRAQSLLKQLKLLKNKDGWSALAKPDHLHLPRRSRAGLNLFEASLWTLVAIALLVSILTLYNSVLDSTRTAALRTQLTRAVAIIERDHSRSGLYANGSLLIFLNNEGFSAKELVKVNDEYVFTSPFDTPIAITGDNTRDFKVTLTNIPAAGCEAAVSAFSDKGAGLDSLEIGGSAIVETDERAVSEACDNDENTVVLTF